MLDGISNFHLCVLGNGPVAAAARLHAFAVDSGCPLRREPALASLLLPVVVHVLDVEGVEVTGEHPAACMGQSPVPCRRSRPRTHPRSVKPTLTSRSAPHPATAKTPRGGTTGPRLALPFWQRGSAAGNLQMMVMMTIRIAEAAPMLAIGDWNSTRRFWISFLG